MYSHSFHQQPLHYQAHSFSSEQASFVYHSRYLSKKAPQGLPENTLKRPQDCYHTCSDYSSFLWKQTLLRQKTFLPFIFPFQTLRLAAHTLGNAELPMEQGAKAAENRGQFTHRGTAPNGACLSSHWSLKTPFEKFISRKLICYTLKTIKNHAYSSKEPDRKEQIVLWIKSLRKCTGFLVWTVRPNLVPVVVSETDKLEPGIQMYRG